MRLSTCRWCIARYSDVHPVLGRATRSNRPLSSCLDLIDGCRSPELQPAEHLLDSWPLTKAPLINRHFSSIEDLEEAQVPAQHCVALQAQPALVRFTALVHWWPQRHSVSTNDTRRGGGSRKR